MSQASETADPAAPSVLARIVAAHGRQAAEARDRTELLSNAWHRALRHAAVPFKGLDLSPATAEVHEHVPLAKALADLPEHGLIAVLEDRDGARGLIVLSHGTIDALVEVQTTGRVDPRELPPRPVTRIDEALSRDFIDLALAAVSRETQGLEDRDWPQRMSFGSRIADRRQLTLLLADRVYHRISARFSMGDGGARDGTVVLVLPRTQAPVPRATAPGGGVAPEVWRAALEDAMADAQVRLEAVLMRTTRSLREVEALAPGDLIAFEPSDLSSVGLEAPGGPVVLRGRLGQMGGLRALRMTEGPPGARDGVVPDVTMPALPEGAVPGAAELPGSAPDLAAPMAGGGLPPLPQPGGPDEGEPSALSDTEGGLPDLPMPAAAPLDFAPASVAIDPDAFPE